jgi:hypothetical protein
MVLKDHWELLLILKDSEKKLVQQFADYSGGHIVSYTIYCIFKSATLQFVQTLYSDYGGSLALLVVIYSRIYQQNLQLLIPIYRIQLLQNESTV